MNDHQDSKLSRRILVGGALVAGAATLLPRFAAAQGSAPTGAIPPGNPPSTAPGTAPRLPPPAAKFPEAARPSAPAEINAATAPVSIAHRPLPYAENALAPYISANTLATHYGKHHKAYIEKTNTLVTGTPFAGKSLDEVVKRSAKGKQHAKLFNNAAQAWNHDFYWQSMKPKGGGAPTGALKERIDKDFGSYEAFREKFIQTGVDHFSNGWVWLVLDKTKLKIVDTHDADTPVVHRLKPLLTTDVWEHAYYLDYKNLRKDYATAFVDHLLNWDFVSANLG